MKALGLVAAAVTLVVMASACADDEAAGRRRPGDPNAAGDGPGTGPATAPNGGSTTPNALPPARIGIMGEAEINEYFVKQLVMTDEKGVLPLVNYIVIGDGPTYEHHSFSADTRRVVRYEYQNTMPSSREIQVFSQTTASGLFALGSRVCVTLFNREMARPSRQALFGVDDLPYEPALPLTERDRILDVLVDKFVMTSVVDLAPVRSEVKAVMQEEFDEAVAAGMLPRDALEESCAVLLGSIAPYLL